MFDDQMEENKGEEQGEEDDKEVEDVLNHLKIFAQVKENEKLATQVCVGVNKPNEFLNWAKRRYYGDSRDKTLAFIENTFKQAFEKINSALARREVLLRVKENSLTRIQMLQRLRNMQRITRLQKAVSAAKDKLFTKLRATYEDDPTTTSRIDILCENIQDKLLEIDASIDFLKHQHHNPQLT